MIEEELYYNNLELFVPQKISRYCVISSHVFLIASILYFEKKKYIFSLLLLLLYISSINHWNHLYIKNFYRIIDKTIVVIIVIYAIIFIFNFNYLYILLIIISGIIWYFNELIYFYEVEIPKKYYNKYELKKRKTVPEIGNIMKKYPDKWNFSKFNNCIEMSYLTFNIINLFNIKPTYNNSNERIYAYYKSVFIHFIFTHIFTFIILIYKYKY